RLRDMYENALKLVRISGIYSAASKIRDSLAQLHGNVRRNLRKYETFRAHRKISRSLKRVHTYNSISVSSLCSPCKTDIPKKKTYIAIKMVTRPATPRSRSRISNPKTAMDAAGTHQSRKRLFHHLTPRRLRTMVSK